MESTLTLWYGASSLLLGVLMFFPIRKFITAIMTNRLQRREKRAATEEEIKRIRGTATMSAAILSVSFGFLYNKYIMFKYFTGEG